eukprot:scaffold721_cov131-Cylindrotheca_fusiformis.AAC.38
MASNRAASRKSRVYVFREFLLEKYPTLIEGSIVLDVAGGAGTLSWLLKNVDGIESVVLDPRKTNTQRLPKSVEYLRANPDQALERSVRNRPTYQPLAELVNKIKADTFCSPSHLRILVDADLVAAVGGFRKSGDLNGWIQFFSAARERGKHAETLGYSEGLERSRGDIADATEALQIILKAKLIIGFHPDQATDPAIDLAEELGIPFCIVPCCVFPSEFPNRLLADGSQVRSYTQLIEFLKLKTQKIQTEKLAFHFAETAKNIALYTRPVGD